MDTASGFDVRSRLPQAGTTIFTVMSALAQEHGAVNLGQGFPDYPIDPGLIDRVKLNSFRYAFAGEKLAVDGDYFGVGFEVVGTRADPQVFLKENAVIRAIGQKNEFDFFGDDAAAPAPKKK